MTAERPGARVSVIVPVKNEAENLRRCLPALAWADEVFVVDSGSTDATVSTNQPRARPSQTSAAPTTASTARASGTTNHHTILVSQVR